MELRAKEREGLIKILLLFKTFIEMTPGDDRRAAELIVDTMEELANVVDEFRFEEQEK